MINIRNKAQRIVNIMASEHFEKNDFLLGTVDIGKETFFVIRSDAPAEKFIDKEPLYENVFFNDRYYDVYKA